MTGGYMNGPWESVGGGNLEEPETDVNWVSVGGALESELPMTLRCFDLLFWNHTCNKENGQ